MRHSVILILKKESFQLLIVFLRGCPLTVSFMLELGIEPVFLEKKKKKEAIKKDVMFNTHPPRTHTLRVPIVGQS